MPERILDVSEDLWVVTQELDDPELDDGLFLIRDCVGGEALVSRDDIPALMDALQQLLDEG